ncbi:HpcH/HpaI aldolase/citrate lyase family protein [Quisquiliibacterium transsilvanicum]|uniref:Citrate lyase subunit beta/citryl-CoA lyase n=1 Tax=Quisquiliibacterium transsilvanicum TaxID=1549638 RepID=A0A7W8HH95_9BURK|nr:CoA ester lyase [Quisquiliibacterium transsilvanicum]MBB5271215.1 citrate lyase subunit beta/citryl-CoA lyase [Quisquiliibacterium transsilvanicum]
MNAPRPRRSAMYVPAINQRAIEKSRSLEMDAVIFDLEDAVAPEMKPQARAQLVEAFAAGGFGHRETVIRVNAVDTDDFEQDLDAVARCQPHAVLLPKVSRPEDLEALSGRLAAHGLPASVLAWAMVETVDALADLDAIVTAGRSRRSRLDCLVVGTNDIAKETGVDPGEQRRYLIPWLMNVVLVARRHRICVLDGVWNDFSDRDGFDAEARQSVKMAFDGKTLIHPSQVEPANNIFSPSPHAVAKARSIAAAFERPENAGKGVINLDGKMVERLHLEQAQRLLEIQAAIAARG